MDWFNKWEELAQYLVHELKQRVAMNVPLSWGIRRNLASENKKWLAQFN